MRLASRPPARSPQRCQYNQRSQITGNASARWKTVGNANNIRRGVKIRRSRWKGVTVSVINITFTFRFFPSNNLHKRNPNYSFESNLAVISTFGMQNVITSFRVHHQGNQGSRTNRFTACAKSYCNTSNVLCIGRQWCCNTNTEWKWYAYYGVKQRANMCAACLKGTAHPKWKFVLKLNIFGQVTFIQIVSAASH